MRMAGKGVVVTGAGTGNGRAFALGFAREGASVAVVDLDEAAARRTVEEIEQAGGRARAIRADVALASDVEAMVEQAVEALGSLDVLVNNAGIRGSASLLEMAEEEWDRHLDVDLKGPFLCTQRVARVMVQQGLGGAIVNITSQMSQQAARNRAAYCTAKAGLAMLTRVAAIELAPYGIRVNAIAPGPIETSMTAPLRTTPEAAEAVARRIPLGRWGQPDDLVGAALFLASPEASFVTGVNLFVDGGLVSAGPAVWGETVLVQV